MLPGCWGVCSVSSWAIRPCPALTFCLLVHTTCRSERAGPLTMQFHFNFTAVITYQYQSNLYCT